MAAAAPHPPSRAFPAPPEGLVVDLVTPLTGDGGLDREGLARLLTRVAPAAAGVMAGSPAAGEGLDLPFKVRLELLQALLAGAADPVPRFFCITGNTWEETRELARAAARECRARRSPGPVYFSDLSLWCHSNRGLPQALEGLAAEVRLPLVLLNLPAIIARRAPVFKRRNLRTHVFKKIAALSGVVGLIYQGDMGRYLNYHYAAAARPGFAFYEADEVNFLTRPGAWGVLSAGAQLLPEAWASVTRDCLHPEEAAGDHEERLARWDLSRRLLELARLARGHPTALLKAALAARGVIATPSLTAATPAAPEPLRDSFFHLLTSMTEWAP